MTQSELLLWLIDRLLTERNDRTDRAALPRHTEERWRLYRALVNTRPPAPVSAEYRAVEDAFLTERSHERGIVGLDAAERFGDDLLWQGDITLLAADAIVNAANAQMLGCFVPNHGCIDNAIHTQAGTGLRLACAAIMDAQGHEERTGDAKITPGFNLPARYVIHTVGPIVTGAAPTTQNRVDLASCYRASLGLAQDHNLESVAFCCISTGVSRVPQREAAEIAVATVRERRQAARAAGQAFPIAVFNVFTDGDRELYRELLAAPAR